MHKPCQISGATNEYYTPEQHLLLAIIGRAIQDILQLALLKKGKGGDEQYLRREAFVWMFPNRVLKSTNKGEFTFEWICDHLPGDGDKRAESIRLAVWNELRKNKINPLK